MIRTLGLTQISIFALLLAGCGPFSTSAKAAQAASAPDITDYIAKMGGWFYKTDWRDDPTDQIGEKWAEYWRQVSYTITPPTPSTSNLTVIRMVEYLQQREDSKGVCSTENVITDSVMIDLRDLDAQHITVLKSRAPVLIDLNDLEKGVTTVAKDPIAPGSTPIWYVNLVMNHGRHLIRVVRTTAPPTIVGFSNGTTSAGSGNATTCPALRNGQIIDATTEQHDVATYPIQFATESEATYLKKLIEAARTTLTPPAVDP